MDINKLKGHQCCVKSVCVSHDNKKIISGSSDKSIKIWDLEAGHLIKTFDGHQNNINSVCISHDNKKIISGSGIIV